MKSDWTTDTKGAGTYAEVNGIKLYYETYGTGRPLILLHGGLGSSETFGPILPMLASATRSSPSTCRDMASTTSAWADQTLLSPIAAAAPGNAHRAEGRAHPRRPQGWAQYEESPGAGRGFRGKGTDR